jgi:LmbE family N-acetylglucosaminyl deacetylase
MGTGWAGLAAITRAVVLAAVAATWVGAGCTPPEVCPPEGALQVVAHADDDLVHLSPDLWRDVRSGRCVRTVYVTAGDAGRPLSASTNREAGIQAAYATMAGVANSWTASDAGVEGRTVRMVTLSAAPQVSLVFLRLPDGGMDAGGFPRYRFQSLPKLWRGSIDQMKAIDGSEAYTRSTLISTLTELIRDFAPSVVRTHDPDVANWDHPDHHSVGAFAMSARAADPEARTLTTYRGYSVMDLPPNVSGEELAGKRAAMLAYGAYDPVINDFTFAVDRQYVIQTGPGPASGPASPRPAG